MEAKFTSSRTDEKVKDLKIRDKKKEDTEKKQFGSRKRRGKSDSPSLRERQGAAIRQFQPISPNGEGTSMISNKFKIETAKNEIMLKVLRAKFDQHLEFKELLLKTGRAYLVCQHNSERYWSDGFDDTGENQLGICLMLLRGEYGGVGIVPKSACYKIKIQTLKERCQSIAPLSKHIIWHIFLRCCLNKDRVSVATLPYLRKSLYPYMKERIKIKTLCPKLRFICVEQLKDLEIVPSEFRYENGIGKLGLLQGYLRLIDKVADDAGLTYMIMPEGLTRAKQFEIAKKFGIQIFKDENILEDDHDKDAIKETYSLLITNGVFKNTVSKEYKEIYSEVITRYRCAMPTPQELLFLCILSQVIFKRCFYPSNNFGSTEKEIGESGALVIGDFAQNAIYITQYSSRWVELHNEEKLVFSREDTGSGGCLRKYEKLGPSAGAESLSQLFRDSYIPRNQNSGQ